MEHMVVYLNEQNVVSLSAAAVLADECFLPMGRRNSPVVADDMNTC